MPFVGRVTGAYRMDPSGVEDVNLKNISNAAIVSEYFEWQLRFFKPYLTGQVLEIGAGIGSISEVLTKYADSLVISDISDRCLEIIKSKLADKNPSFKIKYVNYALGTPVSDAVRCSTFDAIVCINVLEHVENDINALKYLLPSLKKSGRVLLLVPALKNLYGTIDKALGHYRRYDKKLISKVLTAAGYKIETIRYINFVGIFGWWFNSCLLKREVITRSNFKIFRLLFPLVKIIERWIPFPLGLSLIVTARKC